MPWQPSAAGRAARGGGTSTQQINLDIDNLLMQIKMGIWEGLDQTGRMAHAYAKKHAPVRKIFHGQRAQGGGRTKGMRTLTDVEVAAEAEDRDRLGLGPGRGVRTLGRPGTHPGRPRAPQNYQVDPGFGRVGMPNSEAPFNPNFTFRQQTTPEEKSRAADAEGYGTRAYRRMLKEFGITETENRKARLRTNQREVRQADFSAAAGGQFISREEHLSQPRRRIQRTPKQHYLEATGSLRVREHRDRLPHGAYGAYDPQVAGIADAMTGRGRYEAGLGISRGAQQAGRAVILNPETGRLQVGGRLKHGITYKPPEMGESVMTAWVDSPTYYTRYVEFGTRHAHAQPFLRPAVGFVREQMRDNIRKAISRRVRRR